jgi:hypothetical protein
MTRIVAMTPTTPRIIPMIPPRPSSVMGELEASSAGGDVVGSDVAVVIDIANPVVVGFEVVDGGAASVTVGKGAVLPGGGDVELFEKIERAVAMLARGAAAIIDEQRSVFECSLYLNTLMRWWPQTRRSIVSLDDTYTTLTVLQQRQLGRNKSYLGLSRDMLKL